MGLGSRGIRRRAIVVAVLLASVGALLAVNAAGAAAGPGAAPNLVAASRYLAAPVNLKAGHYYQSFPGTADFGLTLDGALALAATGDDDAALRAIVAFIASGGRDPSGQTINDWTGIGTADVSGGAIGKEALLAEVVGRDPRDFGGHDLLAALNASVCARRSGGADASCPAAGAYRGAASVFDQALGIIAQLRAGAASQAAAPVGYLERLRRVTGAFPSVIPPSGGPDVDSTALAAMALALVPGARAAGDVTAGVRWIAGQQEGNGGFPGTGAESTNSTGLAIQALSLRAAAYPSRIRAARSFLASQQNGNGGFNADAGRPGSDLRASAQAAGGAVGTSFGTLRIDLSGSPGRTAAAGGPTPAVTRSASASARSASASAVPSARAAPGTGGTSPALPIGIAAALVVVIAAVAFRLRRRRPRAGP